MNIPYPEMHGTRSFIIWVFLKNLDYLPMDNFLWMGPTSKYELPQHFHVATLVNIGKNSVHENDVVLNFPYVSSSQCPKVLRF